MAACQSASASGLDLSLLPRAAVRDVNCDISTPLLHRTTLGLLRWTANKDDYPPNESSGLTKPWAGACSYVQENSSIIPYSHSVHWGVSLSTFFFSHSLISDGFALFHPFDEFWCQSFNLKTDSMLRWNSPKFSSFCRPALKSPIIRKCRSVFVGTSTKKSHPCRRRQYRLFTTQRGFNAALVSRCGPNKSQNRQRWTVYSGIEQNTCLPTLKSP